MEVKRRTDYAIRMMTRLARQGEHPMSVTRMSTAGDVPYQFARAIQRDLSQAGLIKVVRGSRGGALLSRSADEISLYDIFLATQGEPVSSPCSLDVHWCERMGRCEAHPVWKEIDTWTVEYLKKKKLSDVS